MLPSRVEGQYLGDRHRSLNSQANFILELNPTVELINQLPEVSDVDKLIKIDVMAKSSDNLPLIEKVLCSDDMLLVSRALNKSKWLANDPRITPDYLHTNLFPHMSSKAISKLLLSIRQNIRDEKKADDFYKYFIDKNEPKIAVKWLPLCSSHVVEIAIESKTHIIKPNVFKRLCRKSPDVFKKIMESDWRYSRSRDYLDSAPFLLRTNTDDYLDTVEKKFSYDGAGLYFSARATRFLCSGHQERIMKHIDIYKNKVHLPTVAKCVGKENVKDLILEWSENESMTRWISMENLKPFIEVMPKEGKFEFVKGLFIDQDKKKKMRVLEEERSGFVSFRKLLKKRCVRKFKTSSKNVYEWYVYAPFAQAFNDLKKLIRSESSAEERMAILKVLAICCRKDPKNINTLIVYFVQKHMNEPPKFKLNFVTSLINHTDTHKYDEVAWNKLNEIFHSLEIYTEVPSDPTTVEAIVVYNLLNGKPIDEIISKKLTQYKCTLSSWLKKKSINKQEREVLFMYLYEERLKSIKAMPLDTKDDCEKLLGEIENLLGVLKLFKKNIDDYPEVLNKIREVISAKEEKTWDIQFVNIYDKNKKWRRSLFAESLLISANEDVCLNILKHDPSLLTKHTQSLKKLTQTKNVTLDRFLSKIRIYFPNDLCSEMLKIYENSLNDCTSNSICYKLATRGICVLLDRDRFCNFIQTYIPTNFKVKWSEVDMGLVSVQKGFAQQMYLVRPTIDIPFVLNLSKGYLLQHAMSSLVSILQQVPQHDLDKLLPVLLEGKTSLQKLGVRMALKNLDPVAFTNVSLNIWENTKNKSVRSILFQLTLNHLTSSKENTEIISYWSLLKKYFDTLTPGEYKKVKFLLSKTDKVPEIVRPDFCRTSYEFLEGLPKNMDCDNMMYKIFEQVRHHIELADPNWVETVLLKYAKALIYGKQIDAQLRAYRKVSVAHILCSSTQESQLEKYKRILKPFIAHLVDSWYTKKNHELRHELYAIILKVISEAAKILTLQKYATPTKIFEDLANVFKNVPIQKSYKFLCILNLGRAMCKAYEHSEITLIDSKTVNIDINDCTNDTILNKVGTEFSKRCVDIVNHDTSKYCPSVKDDFCEMLGMVLERLYGCGYYTASSLDVYRKIIEAFTEDKDNITNHLVAMKLVPDAVNSTESLAKDYASVMMKFEEHESQEVRFHYYERFKNARFDL